MTGFLKRNRYTLSWLFSLLVATVLIALTYSEQIQKYKNDIAYYNKIAKIGTSPQSERSKSAGSEYDTAVENIINRDVDRFKKGRFRAPAKPQLDVNVYLPALIALFTVTGCTLSLTMFVGAAICRSYKHQRFFKSLPRGYRALFALAFIWAAGAVVYAVFFQNFGGGFDDRDLRQVVSTALVPPIFFLFAYWFIGKAVR